MDEKNIRYLVVGGLAVVLHGFLRFTADLDIIPSFASDDLSKLMGTLQELGYKPRLPVDPKDFLDPAKRGHWIKEKNMRVFSFIHPDKPLEMIDLFVDSPIDFEKAYKNKQIFTSKQINIPVPAIEDMIRLKELAGRPQDIEDLEALREINEKSKQ
ncbi:MAG: DUF6036 family nucleotidyltransferase [Candidatus Margulisiibacteriota bacterium]